MDMTRDDDVAIRALYSSLLAALNSADAPAFAALFAQDGDVIGFDGSVNRGRNAIGEEMSRIFADHPTGRYVGKVRRVLPLDGGGAILRAVAGMVPAGQDDLNPELNAIQSLVAQPIDGEWRILLYQ